MGHVHTVEAWREGRLVGGLYGAEARRGVLRREHVLRRARCLEGGAGRISSRGLKRGGFQLLDTQFLTEHLAQFGAIEIPRDDYVKLLDEALRGEADFDA